MEKENLNTVEGYQLSINQMNLWSIASKNIEKYYNQVVIDLEDKLTIEKLRRVLALVVRKNETLMFTMSSVSGATFPVQLVSESSEAAIYEETVRALDAATIHEITNSYLSDDYDPNTSNALRACLLTDADNNQVLVLRLFSLWADTYSAMYLCNELSKALQDETAYENEEKEVVEYQDFAAWQQQLFNDPEEEGVNFWKNYTVDTTKEILPFKKQQEGLFTPHKDRLFIYT